MAFFGQPPQKQVVSGHLLSISMHIDPYTQSPIYRAGIWTETDCLSQEKITLDAIISTVEDHGFTRSTENDRTWIRDRRRVVICLVDDMRSASHDYETDTPYLFDEHTTVITDNYIGCPTRYQVINLPHSFFGIYNHSPAVRWQPDRAFCFSVNRIDDRRTKLMLELALRSHLTQGYINFNCQKDSVVGFHVPDLDRLRDNFRSIYKTLGDQDKEKYRASFNMLSDMMPYRNYDISHEEIHARSRCNIIVESYGSDTTVAFSEKIFRALVLPVPWTVYCGHYGVARLESLGFDCMSDVIHHNHYDQLKEIEDKNRIFIWFSLKFARESSQIDQHALVDRCQQAAAHNRALLATYQQRWAKDFHGWLQDLKNTLTNL